ncbi:MAG TPA: hypothetical protein ENI69_00260 [Rhodospirillales bacterium]|nr:hypothetical protein [Rhodospirillales bacterium]
MRAIFTAEYQWLWTLALALGLFLPVRRMIWIMSVRRFEAKKGPSDEARRAGLKRRATVTSALLCLVFSVIYAGYMFRIG